MDLVNHALVKELSERYRNNKEVVSKKYKEIEYIEEQLKNEEISFKLYNSLKRQRDHIKSIIMHIEDTNDGICEAREIVMNYLLNENVLA